MAVVLTAFDLIVRVDAIEGGISTFARAVPNSTFCTDDRIARVSFMNPDDRDDFLARLVDLPADAVARVHRHGTESGAEWLERGPCAGLEAVWLKDEPREPLVVPVYWKPTEVAFKSAKEVAEHLELVGVEGNVQVYRDKRTGQKLYAARTQPVVDPERAAEADALRTQAADIVKPLFGKLLSREPLALFEKRRLRASIEIYEKVLAVVPHDWAAHWMIGMLLRGTGDHERARDHFEKAYDVNPRNPDVGREYAAQHMILGRGSDAVRIGRELCARFPDDAGLQSNLGLALLIAGQVDEALAVVKDARARDPEDPITRALLEHVEDVRRGRAQRPTRLPGY